TSIALRRAPIASMHSSSLPEKTMYRRILVPVDGSAISMLGLRHAIGLAKSQRARLRVLNVLDARTLVPALGGYSEADVKAILSGNNTAGRDLIREAAALAAKS